MSYSILGKWGNSVGIRIPLYMMKAMELKAGDKVDVAFKANVITITAQSTKRQEFEAYIDGFRPEQ